MKDGGSIILNGSVASVKGTAAFGVYGATKAALRSFVRTWTSDLKDRHIRSNVISPGPTDTPVIDGQPADAIARIVSTIPMGRMGDPDEIAKAALFLASDDSSFVTGIELFVDGGRGQASSRDAGPKTLACHFQAGCLRRSATVFKISRESASSETARASDIAPTRALNVRIAFDLAAGLSLPGSSPTINSRSTLT